MSANEPSALPKLAVLSYQQALAIDFCEYVVKSEMCEVALFASEPVCQEARAAGLTPHLLSEASGVDLSGNIERVVVFSDGTETGADSLSRIVASILNGKTMLRIVLISDWRVHRDREDLRQFEIIFERLAEKHHCDLTVIRSGVVVDGRSPTAKRIRLLSGLRFALTPHLTSCFLGSERLFKIITQEAFSVPPASLPHIVTVLGQNRPWREVLGSISGSQQGVFAWLFAFFAMILLRWLPQRLLVKCFTGIFSKWRWIDTQTLRPQSTYELLCLYNRYSFLDIQIAGYNNGFNHFGWQHPGKTVVLTVESGRRCRVSRGTLLADAGMTLKSCLDVLGQTQFDLHVVPNFSYISMGTLFFVPVHGSGSQVSTLSETIDQVLLYDPRENSLKRIKRGDSDFSKYAYNTREPGLLLRLRLRLRERIRFQCEESTLEAPSATEVLAVFDDKQAANIEVRKTYAADTKVHIKRFLAVPDRPRSAGATDETLSVARDRVGRVWDRLEETPVVASLFHWFVRSFGYHVELFMNESEFRNFWEHHPTLPLSKIQLRKIHRDNLAHSPVGFTDRISADLFLLQRNKAKFRKYLQQQLPEVSYNPGKQSV